MDAPGGARGRDLGNGRSYDARRARAVRDSAHLYGVFPDGRIRPPALRCSHEPARRALMAAPPRRLERVALRLLTAADAAGNRLLGSPVNPLYQSGTIVAVLL